MLKLAIELKTLTATAILLYEYFATFESEVKFFWPPHCPLGWVSFTFLLNRYATLFGHIPVFLSLIRYQPNEACRCSVVRRCSSVFFSHSLRRGFFDYCCEVKSTCVYSCVIFLRFHVFYGALLQVLVASKVL
jgi:hypothetical protein